MPPSCLPCKSFPAAWHNFLVNSGPAHSNIPPPNTSTKPALRFSRLSIRSCMRHTVAYCIPFCLLIAHALSTSVAQLWATLSTPSHLSLSFTSRSRATSSSQHTCPHSLVSTRVSVFSNDPATSLWGASHLRGLVSPDCLVDLLGAHHRLDLGRFRAVTTFTDTVKRGLPRSQSQHGLGRRYQGPLN